MNVEIKVKIETDKINVELTEEEARELYGQLREFFELPEITKYIPYEPPQFPFSPWRPLTPPYYVGDRTGDAPHIIYTVTSGNTKEN